MILSKDSMSIYTQTKVAWITTMWTTRVYSWMWKIQPAQRLIEWSFDWMWALEVFEVYTEFMGVNIWDKIVINSVNYYVKWKEEFTWILRNYTKCLVNSKFD